MKTNNIDIASNFVGIYILVLPAFIYLFLSIFKFLNIEETLFNEKDKNFLVKPAIVANKFLENIFGKTEGNWKKLFTFRSLFLILSISFLTNSIALVFILINAPSNLPTFDFELIKIFGLSYLMFIIFNFLGDLISINITRHIVYKISTQKKIFKNVMFDLFGIVIGYFITLLPIIAIFIVSLISDVELNFLIQYGFIGNAFIPFVLYMFATTTMPTVFFIIALFAVFSITIPTLLYITILLSFYSYSLISKVIKINNYTIIDLIIKVSKFLSSVVAPIALAILFAFKYI